MLAGEAGIGKSRVAEALRERLGAACVPLRFQCSPHYVNRALHPVIQHIELGRPDRRRGSGGGRSSRSSRHG